MMAEQSTLNAQGIAAEFAAIMPAYDPLRRPRRPAGRRLIVLSILIHLGLLLAFWNTLISAVIEEEEVITVKMIEEQKPEPDPPKLKRKTVARRVVDASVRTFKEVVQHKIEVVKPVPVLERASKVELKRVKTTEAPKQIEHKRIVTQKVNPFAEFQAPAQPVEVDKVTPTVRQIRSARASAGPRKVEAASPTTNARAVDVEAPVVARGIISDTAVDGDLEGTEVVALESGNAEGILNSADGLGLIPGADKDCMKDPICVRYLKLIRDRVYARWQPGLDVLGGRVTLRFRIDRGGSAHGIAIEAADEKVLGDTCLAAFRHASPFPPPPKEIHYLVTKGLIATFHYSHD